MILMMDFDSETPIYMQIKNQIIKGIAKGTVENIEELPSVRALAEDIGVNMHTVNKAYNLLKDEGYIKIDRRKGAVISLNLDETTGKFKEKMTEEIDYFIAECINRRITQEELNSIINAHYANYFEKVK